MDLEPFYFNHFFRPVSRAVLKYRDHVSVIKIRSLFKDTGVFNFSETTTESVHKIVMSLNSGKVSSSNISTKMLKLSSYACSTTLKSYINSAINSARFPDSLKRAIISPIFKKGDSTQVGNYRPISILPTVSKLYEKVLSSQLESSF